MDTLLVLGWLAVADRVASPEIYTGPSAGIRIGHAGALHASADVRFARLTAPSLGKRRFEADWTDPLTGETATFALKPRPTALDLHAEVGFAKPVGAVLWAQGTRGQIALSGWASSALRVGPEVRVPTGPWAFTAKVAVVSVVTRFPWSGNPIQPGRKLTGGFFATGTRVAPPWTHASLAGSARWSRDHWTAVADLGLTHDTQPRPLTRLDLAISAGRTW